MTAITWDKKSEHLYETGTDHGVLYPVGDNGAYNTGVAWNGLSKVTESPEGAEETAIYADNIKYLSLLSAESFKGTIEAYTYPDEFAECDGSASLAEGITIAQQNRKMFGFVYRTIEGNDTAGNEYNEKLHIIYGAKASPSERAYETVNDSPSAITFSWEFSTTPEEVDASHKATANVTIDKKSAGENYQKICDKLFGTDDEEPTLLLPADIVALVSGSSPTGQEA